MEAIQHGRGAFFSFFFFNVLPSKGAPDGKGREEKGWRQIKSWQGRDKDNGNGKHEDEEKSHPHKVLRQENGLYSDNGNGNGNGKHKDKDKSHHTRHKTKKLTVCILAQT